MDERVTMEAPAKINLCLEVLGKRADGYHEISTILQTVDLVDILTFEVADGVSLEVQPAGAAPVEGNLVLRAARLLADAHGIRQGARINLTKRIPAAAGLGGGSSDAAATLLGLSRLWGISASVGDLGGIATRLGSDVPFFLRGGTALATGRGERLRRLPGPAERWAVLLLRSDEGEAKTARLYGLLRPEHFMAGAVHTTAMIDQLDAGQGIASGLHNAFDEVASAAHPGFNEHHAAFIAAGAKRAILAGAGPSLVALEASAATAEAVAGKLRQAGWDGIAVQLREPR